MRDHGVKQYLNLGCGSHYHPKWINIDVLPHAPGVVVHDLSHGIPMPDGSVDVVYHSHLLEHLRRADVFRFMLECCRVLKPGGILRVATPDLERICHIYLRKMTTALAGDASSAFDYQWIMLEMYDQTVRERSGGEMLAYLQQNPLPNGAFVYERLGEEGRTLSRNLRNSANAVRPESNPSRRKRRTGIRTLFRRLNGLPNVVRTRLLAYLVGAEGMRALEIGRFRLAGEVHHWMYDRYSLSQLMLSAGFQHPIQQSAGKSLIPKWSSFNLDTLPDGTVRKPDSLFMEAVKPT